MASKRTIEKSKRLPVVEITDSRAYAVVGDSGTYMVIESSGLWWCSCPHKIPDCSHILAAQGLTDK